jgi:propionyl-CoA carboxylase alpha chain
MSELEALMPVRDDAEGLIEMVAPLAGQIISINVKVGEEVVLGQDLIVLTAMKMENIITAERIGKIAKILVKELDNVASGQVLLEFE